METFLASSGFGHISVSSRIVDCFVERFLCYSVSELVDDHYA